MAWGDRYCMGILRGERDALGGDPGSVGGVLASTTSELFCENDCGTGLLISMKSSRLARLKGSSLLASLLISPFNIASPFSSSTF